MEGKNLDMGVNGVGYEDNIESAIKCQTKCQENSQCQSFVYGPSEKRCYFKSRKVDESDITANANNVAGPKYCSK